MQDILPSSNNLTPDVVLTQRIASPLPAEQTDNGSKTGINNQNQTSGAVSSSVFAGGRRASSVGAYLAVNRHQISALQAEDAMKRSTTPLSDSKDAAKGLDSAVFEEEPEMPFDEVPHMPCDSLGTGRHIHFSTDSPAMTPSTPAPLESPFPRSTATSIMELNPIPSARTSLAEISRMEMEDSADDPHTPGKIASVRGAIIIAVTATAQLMDLIYLTSVNIALPQMQTELTIAPGNLQWLVSAYTLAFGGFLLLAGVVADRFGKRITFCTGMVWLTIWSLAVSFANNEISAIVFRALQGLGAAATVPSAIGVICTYFAGKEQNRAMSFYGAAGAVGFVAGLILGGLLTATLGWRWIFRVTAPLTAILAVVAWFQFPVERKRPTDAQPSMDIAGACLGTLSMVLLTLGLSSSEAHGWGKAIAIAPIVIAVVVLGGFLLTERKVKNPVMPLWLWKQPSFAAIWFAAFFMQAWWGSLVYYLVLIAQGPLHLSPLQTAVRLAPCGVWGFIITVTCGPLLQRFSTKKIIVTGLGVCILANIPSALVKPYQSFWASTFLSMMIAVTGVSWAYNVLAISLVSSVPAGIKSTSGGLINTAFQIGTAVGLSLCGVVSGSVSHNTEDDDDFAKMRAYSAALWMSTGLAVLAFLIALFGIKGGHKAGAQAPVH